MLSRARYSWPGSNYPVMLDDCRAGPPPSAASAAEASLPDPRPVRAPFLSGVSPLPGSRPRLSMYAAPDMGPFSGACAAGFVSLAEKSSLEKNLCPFCCHKNTSFILTCQINPKKIFFEQGSGLSSLGRLIMKKKGVVVVVM